MAKKQIKTAITGSPYIFPTIRAPTDIPNSIMAVILKNELLVELIEFDIRFLSSP